VERASLEACSSGTDAIALLKTDAAASDAQGASASPTLIINDVKYSGARTPEAYKQAICNSFETVPAECSTSLSGTSAADTGKCA
ncbi:MAG: thioredoxin domain-containing protein, partial [Methanoregula sp.]|nr:thioredoxin domain-containing protein [Methanoregula sp.]